MTRFIIEGNPLVKAKKEEKGVSPPKRWFVKFWLRTEGKNTMPLIAIVSKAQLELIKKNIALRGGVTVLKEVDPGLYQELLDLDFEMSQKKNPPP